MTYIGAPVIYYGDEIGTEEYGDPDCRRTFKWKRESQNIELLNFYKKMIRFRKSYPALRKGKFKSLYFHNHVYCYIRKLVNQVIMVVFNNSDCEDIARIDIEKLNHKYRKGIDLVETENQFSIDKNEVQLEIELAGYEYKIFSLLPDD